MKQVIRVNRVSAETVQGLINAGFTVIITNEKPKAKLQLVKDDTATLDLINEFSEFLKAKAS